MGWLVRIKPETFHVVTVAVLFIFGLGLLQANATRRSGAAGQTLSPATS